MLTPFRNNKKKFVEAFIPRPSRLRNLASLYGYYNGLTPVPPDELGQPVQVTTNKIAQLHAGAWFIHDGYLKHSKSSSAPAPDPAPAPDSVPAPDPAPAPEPAK